MSKEALYEVEIENAIKMILDRAIDEMLMELEGQRMFVSRFNIYNNRQIDVKGVCIKLKGAAYPCTVYINNSGKVIVEGDSMDVQLVAGRVKQFYEATEFATTFRAPMRYNKKTDEIDMQLAVEV